MSPAPLEPVDPYAPFRPRRARRVAYAVGVAALLLMLALAAVVPGVQWWDRAAFALVGLAILWFMHRQASVTAVPSPAGLVVRNLLTSRQLEWPQVVAVRFGDGRPWVELDLDDGDTLSVMAVQRSDGVRAEAEAGRLAGLVVAHSRTERDS